MGLNNAEYIDGLNANDPAYNDLVADAASHLRAIKKAMKQTFPNVNGAVTEGPDGINTFESRIAALEANPVAVTPMASGRDTLSGAGALTISGLSFQPEALFITAARNQPGGNTSASASISFGLTDGTTHLAQSHEVNYNNGTSFLVGNDIYTDRVAQVDFVGGNSKIVWTSFNSDGFTLTQSGSSPQSTIVWTAWGSQ